MKPIIGKFYQMKTSYIEKIKNDDFRVMPHIYDCGNKFEFLSHIRSLMKCVNCGHTYETDTSVFSNLYESAAGQNPNILFKRRF